MVSDLSKVQPTLGARPLRVFISYAQQDDAFRSALETHLALLRRQQLIDSWHDRRISPGDNRHQVIDDQLNSAELIILLISADFLASDYCYEIELSRALERQASGVAVVIPILIRAVDWKLAPFGHLQALPISGKPIAEWEHADKAWQNVVEGIRELVLQHPTQKRTTAAATSDARGGEALTPPAAQDAQVGSGATAILKLLRAEHGPQAQLATQKLLLAFDRREAAFDLSSNDDPGPTIELIDPNGSGLRVRLMDVLVKQGKLRLYPPYLETDLRALGIKDHKVRELVQQWTREFNLLTKARPGRSKPDKGETAAELSLLSDEQIDGLLAHAKRLYEQLVLLRRSAQLPATEEQTQPASHTYFVLVAGTGNPRLEQQEPVQAAASQMIGRALALNGFGLVTGGWPGVDFLVAKSFAETIAGRPRRDEPPLSQYLKQVMPRGRDPLYPSGDIQYVSSEDDAFQLSAELADAVVLIGGLGGTMSTANTARLLGKPVLPLAQTGGDAGKLYQGVLRDSIRLFSYFSLSKEDFLRLGEPLESAIENLLDLLRRLRER